MNTFGRRLAQLRQTNQLTQAELAVRLGISRSAIGMYERGAREPDFATLLTLADHFAVDMNELFGAPDTGHRDRLASGHPDGSNPADDEARRVAQAYRAADPGTRTAIRKLLDL